MRNPSACAAPFQGIHGRARELTKRLEQRHLPGVPPGRDGKVVLSSVNTGRLIHTRRNVGKQRRNRG